MFEFLFKYSQQDFARSDLVFTAQWPAWMIAVIAVAAVGAISFALFRRHRSVGLAQLAVVWALQVAMLAVVLIVVAEPALRTEQLKPGENTVALVVDESASMAYGAPATRFDTAVAALESVIAADTAYLSARRFSFAGAETRRDSFEGLAPTGAATSIAGSLAGVIEGARSESLAAVVLASDGIDTTGGVSAAQLAEIAALGVPVHTIGVGRDRLPEDLELGQVLVPKKALPGSTVAARVAIRHDREGEVLLRVYDGDRLVATQPVLLPATATTTTARIDVDLPAAGFHRLRFSVDGIDAEPEMRNNGRVVLVEAEEQKFDALYFEGEPRWEYKFLRRAIDPEGDIRLASLLRVSPNKFYRQGLESADELAEGFPATRDALFAYDALIIGSVEAASLTSEQLEIVRDFVSVRGGSLLLLAGRNGLGNGGWGQSEIADLLPVRLAPSSMDTFSRVRTDVRLTVQGADTEMLRLADTPEQNLDAWSGLPAVADYQALGSLKPAAITLLEAVTPSGAAPLLVMQPYGRGQVFVLATSGTWRWQMSMPLEDLSHETFWKQLMRALVAGAPGKVSLTADASEAGVSLRAEFRDDAFRPVDDVSVSVVVSHEDGESFTVDLAPSEETAGVFNADVPLGTSGSWYFEAIAARDGEAALAARASAYSEAAGSEHFNLRRNAALLRRIADATGGHYFDAAEIDALPDLLRYSAAGITEQILRPVWDAPIVFLLLLSLKIGEWLLRRRWRTI